MSKEQGVKNEWKNLFELLFIIPLSLFPVFGLLLVLYMWSLPYLILEEKIEKFQEEWKINAKYKYEFEGIISRVEVIENPDLTAHKQSKETSYYVGINEHTKFTFTDGRIKIFVGVPTFQIPLNKSVIITYDGNNVITKIEEKKEGLD